MRYAALLLALLSACAHTPDECARLSPSYIAMAYDDIWAAYEAQYGFAVATCEFVRPVRTTVVAQGSFPDRCPEPRNMLRGCSYYEFKQPYASVWVRECDPDHHRVLMHEGLHVLLGCDQDIPEPNHGGEVWSVLGVQP